ncbi:MAG TPA: nuclear transport factor 2 family protein [Acidothermaceae bacterium]
MSYAAREVERVTRVGLDYAASLDAKAWAEFSECFTPDGVLQTAVPARELRGRAKISSGSALRTDDYAQLKHTCRVT